MITNYNFEHFELNDEKKYYIFYEVFNDQKQFIWASGYAGYGIVAYNASPEEYPTAPYPFGIEGNCVKMETKSTIPRMGKIPH